jgi:hypothetical protein
MSWDETWERMSRLIDDAVESRLDARAQPQKTNVRRAIASAGNVAN